MSDDQAKLIELLEDMRIAMFTTFGPTGPRTVPMARREVEPSAELWFISARDSEHAHAIAVDPSVSLSFSSSDAWVALTGRAELVDDQAKLEDMWSTFAEAWLPGGPDNGQAVLIRVDIEQGEYWDTPGSRIASLISFAKTKVTGEPLETGHGTVST